MFIQLQSTRFWHLFRSNFLASVRSFSSFCCQSSKMDLWSSRFLDSVHFGRCTLQLRCGTCMSPQYSIWWFYELICVFVYENTVSAADDSSSLAVLSNSFGFSKSCFLFMVIFFALNLINCFDVNHRYPFSDQTDRSPGPDFVNCLVLSLNDYNFERAIFGPGPISYFSVL